MEKQNVLVFAKTKNLQRRGNGKMNLKAIDETPRLFKRTNSNKTIGYQLKP